MTTGHGDIRQRFGLRIRELRDELGWSQERLAEQADMSVTHLSVIERGLANPTIATVQKIATALGRRMPELF